MECSGEATAGRETHNAVADKQRKPEVAIRPARDADRHATSRVSTGPYKAELGDAASSGDTSNPVPIQFREPEVAIRAARDAPRLAATRESTVRWQWELGDTACGGDAPDLVPSFLGEPEVAIRASRDALRPAAFGGDAELGDAATGGAAPDLAYNLGEPEVAIWPGRNAPRPTAFGGGGELGNAAIGCDAPDVVPSISEPEIAIRPGRDSLRRATLRGDGEMSDAATGCDAPDVVRLGEPEIAIRAGRYTPGQASRRELGEGANDGPGRKTAQAQQADTGDQGGEKCGQVRPPSRTIHVSSSFVSDGKRPTGNESLQDRSVDRDAELLGGLHACVVRDGLGKRERPCRSGSAADGGPPIGPCGQRETGRQLSRRNRPGVGEAPAIGKEVGEVCGPDGRWRRGWAGDHQWQRLIDGDAEWLRRRFTSAILDLDGERAGLDLHGRAVHDGGLDPIGRRHRQSSRKRARHNRPGVER